MTIGIFVFFSLLFFQQSAYAEAALVTEFKQSCEANIPESCVTLGALYIYGRGVEQNYQKAAALYQKACDLDGVVGCNILASNYRDGTEDMPQNYEKAISLFQRSCTLGDPSACEDLVKMFTQNLGGIQNAKTKKHTLQKACDLGSQASCQKLDAKYSVGSYIEKECKENNAHSCFQLGIMYKQGKSVPKAHQKALVFLQKACNNSHAMACYELGSIYQYGQSTTQDFPKAAQAYQQACDYNESFGCNKAGFIFYQKLNNSKTAIEYFQKGCEKQDHLACENLKTAKRDHPLSTSAQNKCDHGDIKSCYDLGFLYFQGEDISSSSHYPYLVEKDYQKAFSLFTKGCNAGEAESCRVIGIMYKNGFGISANQQKANLFFKKSCELGAYHACALIP